ncbi:MAG: hypothetical protein ACOCWM_03145 [Cyclobacteriaceae bacterium]
MARLDAMVQGNASINDAPINVVTGGKRGTGDNGRRKNPNATKTIHMTEEEVELLTMFLARAPNIYTHKDGRSLMDQRNTSVSKYTTNPLAKEISVKSRLVIQINNLLEETQKHQSMVHGTFYTYESSRLNRKLKSIHSGMLQHVTRMNNLRSISFGVFARGGGYSLVNLFSTPKLSSNSWIRFLQINKGTFKGANWLNQAREAYYNSK